MRHTPGPWHWDGDGFLWSKSDPNFEVSNGGSVYRKQDRDIIALAPEMFDELEFILDHCLEKFENIQGDETEQIVIGKSGIERIRQLVSKIKGESA